MHKHLKNEVANLINYMSSGDTFYGFVNISPDDFNWGVEINGEAFCAVHILPKSLTTLSDEPEKEAEAINKGHVFPVLFYGSDNTSYLMRFKLEETMGHVLQDMEHFDRFEETCYYYNS